MICKAAARVMTMLDSLGDVSNSCAINLVRPFAGGFVPARKRCSRPRKGIAQRTRARLRASVVGVRDALNRDKARYMKAPL